MSSSPCGPAAFISNPLKAVELSDIDNFCHILLQCKLSASSGFCNHCSSIDTLSVSKQNDDFWLAQLSYKGKQSSQHVSQQPLLLAVWWTPDCVLIFLCFPGVL